MAPSREPESGAPSSPEQPGAEPRAVTAQRGARRAGAAAGDRTGQPLELLRQRARRSRLLGLAFDTAAGVVLGGVLGVLLAMAGAAAPRVGAGLLGGLAGGLAAAGMASSARRSRPGAARAAAGRRDPPAAPTGLAAMARHVDATLPQAEWSAELLLANPALLPLLARRQRERIERALAAPGAAVALPRATWGRPLLRLLAAVALSVALGRGWRPGGESGSSGRAAVAPPAAAAAAAQPAAPAITRLRVEIDPPAYTRLPPHFADSWQVRAEEGARVRFRVELRGPVEAAALRFGSEDLPLARGADGVWLGERRAQRAELYDLHALAAGGREVLRGPLARLDVVADRPPELAVLRPRALTVVAPGTRGSLTLEVAARDDYGVAGVDAHLVVAHGGGEQVTFRELHRPLAPRGGGRFAATLDLADLGLAAGVEAYLYFEARDNREPEPGRTRSATLRILVPGSGAERSGALGGGIVLQSALAMFRSERQIILDTRQLLAERARLAPGELQRRAEGIGFDQRALRLRYGALLGEEVESGAAVEAAAAEVEALRQGRGAAPGVPPPAGAAAAKGASGPATAAAGEAGEVERDEDGARGPAAPGGQEARATGASRGGPGGQAEALAQVLPQGMVHLHDSAASATFLPDELRRGMREVLGEMWNAEGRLRTGQPRDALPYEERALRRLKEVQQSSRAYVAKAAFTAPEVDPARRLSGDLAAIPAQRVRRETPAPEPLRQLFGWSQAACEAPPPPAPAAAVRAAGERALAGAALAGDGEALAALAVWRAAARPGCREARSIAAPLWRLLEPPPPLGRTAAEEER